MLMHHYTFVLLVSGPHVLPSQMSMSSSPSHAAPALPDPTCRDTDTHQTRTHDHQTLAHHQIHSQTSTLALWPKREQDESVSPLTASRPSRPVEPRLRWLEGGDSLPRGAPVLKRGLASIPNSCHAIHGKDVQMRKGV